MLSALPKYPSVQPVTVAYICNPSSPKSRAGGAAASSLLWLPGDLLTEKGTFNSFIPPESTSASPADPGLCCIPACPHLHLCSLSPSLWGDFMLLAEPAYIFWYLSEQGCLKVGACGNFADLKIFLIQKFEFSFQIGKSPWVGPWSLGRPFQLQVLRSSLPCLHQSEILILFHGWLPAGC